METTQVAPPRAIDRIISLIQTGPKPLVLRFVDQITRKITGAPVWYLSRVRPFLYVGGQQRPNGWAEMELEGITAVINMREVKHDDVAMGVGGERHLHLATRDNTPITFENLQQAADFIAAEKAQGGKVYVHCGVGVGRAPLAAASYFIKYEGMSATEALDTIREVRPFIHPTSKQRQHLNDFAASLEA